ncbi:Aldehyde/histidinol dehydrogenase [Aspergillus coremiiformis]|uniref:Aldehyde/histidinol dehydrogenase n=1 Tax=Aspergillus coremiiformis TaxID=138285 RepID=A0A5N6ZF98_9EURO|nr:Aldehyde/histidinol dehydrogenase [Aspergillus coremiiformis]
MAMSPQPWELDTLEDAEGHLQRLDFQPFQLQNLVNGDLMPHPHPDWIDSVNPKTGLGFACIPQSTPEQIDAAVKAAEAAFPSWSATPPSQRSQYLQRIASRIEKQRELFAVWESIDHGMTITRARVEVDRAVSNFRYFATFILHQETRARWTDSNTVTYEHRSPKGVFALITPWNMPLDLLTGQIAPCLAFGCTAVAKPSETTSMTAYLLSTVFQEVSLPPGIINVVYGPGHLTGTALISHPLIKGICFTGTPATGHHIRRNTLDKYVSLNLTGKTPTLIFDDVDIENAVATAAAAAFASQGEICLRGSQIYVQRTIWSQFISRFASHVEEQYILGDAVGAVVSLSHYRQIRSVLSLATDDPDSVFHLGSIPPEHPEGGFWIEPAVVSVTESSPLWTEEAVGPVVLLSPFDGEEEVVRRANDGRYGWASVLLTRDEGRMRRVGERLQAGLDWFHCWMVPGAEGSRDVFTAVRTLHVPRV